MSEPKLRGLFLDDERWPSDVTWIGYPENLMWTVIRTCEEFMAIIDSDKVAKFDIISFDNDLGTYREGRHAANHLCSTYYYKAKRLPICFVHSKNPIAATAIQDSLRDGLMREQANFT